MLPLGSVLLALLAACVASARGAPPGPPAVTVMTYNLFGFGGTPAVTVALIEERLPELLLLQEVTPRWRRRLSARILAHYPHRLVETRVDAYGFALFSLHRLDEPALLSIPGAPPYALCARALLPAGWAMVCDLHLKSPFSVFVGHRDIVAGWRANHALRQRQWRHLLAWLAHAAPELPHILAGDTNTPGFDDLNDEMAERYVDALAAAHLWTDSTFPNAAIAERALGSFLPAIPFVRLDYVWVSPGIRVLGAEVIAGGGSDHLPVVATLALPAPD